MSGPRILLVLALAVGLMSWLALFGDEQADLERGLEETDMAFANVEDELMAMDPIYTRLTRQGLMLGLKQQHDHIRSQLAILRAECLHVRDDRELDRRERLPRMRELARRGDELYVMARSLHDHIKARNAFMEASSPLLGRARALRDALADIDPADEAVQARNTNLAGALAVLLEQARTTDRLLQENLSQGEAFGQATLAGLRDLIAEQEALLGELSAGPP